MTERLPHTEKALLEAIAEGDEWAFGELYKHYYPKLLPVVTSYADSRFEADEIVQEP